MTDEHIKVVRSHDDQVSELCSDLRASLTALESKITVELSEAEERGAAEQRRKDAEDRVEVIQWRNGNFDAWKDCSPHPNTPNHWTKVSARHPSAQFRTLYSLPPDTEGDAYEKSAEGLIEHYRKKYPETAAAWAENPPSEKVKEPKKTAREIAEELAKFVQCTCDLDNWQPEATTGHSRVCRIHKAAVAEYWGRKRS